ncbi:MAG TPA: tyrosine-type recombinase/integrase [Roseiflexaceae bacterium]|nr:tyrosine-type recombinase/integrase [Roseiflexaceae bacterium]
MTLDLAHTWEQALAEADVAAPTRRRYLGVLRDFLVWFEARNHEPFSPARLTPIDLTGYRAHRQAAGQSPSTVNVAVCALRKFADWLVESGQRDEDVARRFKMVGTQAPLAPKALTPAATNALIRESQQGRHAARNEALVQLLLQTGLRIGEGAALVVGDLTIRARAGQVVVRAGKGNKHRVVPLNASARAALVSYLAECWGVEDTLTAVLAVWDEHDPAAPLWVSQKGGRLHVRSLGKVIEELVASCARRGLVPADTTPHTLRHTFAATYLASNPGDLVGLAALLGHTTLETTKIYVQPTQANLAARVEGSSLNAYG